MLLRPDGGVTAVPGKPSKIERLLGPARSSDFVDLMNRVYAILLALDDDGPTELIAITRRLFDLDDPSR